ncbi:MAG: hypothetical protein ACI9XP_000451 [Lentimonas sp.]|jgi:hypothetical protein
MKTTLLPLLILIALSSCRTTLQIDKMSQFRGEYTLATSNEKYGVLDSNFKFVLDPIYDEIIHYPLSEYSFEHQFYGTIKDVLYIKTIGKDTIDRKINNKDTLPFLLKNQGFYYQDAHIKSSNNYYVVTGNNDWGAIKTNGDSMIPFEYDQIALGLDSQLVATKGFYGIQDNVVYDANGKVIWKTYNVPIMAWEEVNLYWFIFLGQRSELRDQSNGKFELIEKFDYTNVIMAGKNSWVQEGETWFLIDSKFEPISKTVDSLQMNANWGAVWKDGKVALVDKNGEFISGFSYTGTKDQYISKEKRIVAYHPNAVDILDMTGHIKKKIRLKKLKN